MRRSYELLLLACASCGGTAGPVDLTGVYRVDTDVRAADCGAEQPSSQPIAYVRFAPASAGYAAETCSDAAATMCSPGRTFEEQIDDGWRDTSAYASIGGEVTICLLTFEESLVLLEGGRVTWLSTRYGDTLQPTSPQCSDAEAARRGDTMTCRDHTRIVATKL